MTSVALVTGGSRGIGRAVALRLAEDGNDVAVGYAERAHEAERVAEQIRALGRRAITVGGDLSQPDVARQLVDRVEADLAGVDVLVANAGIASPPTGILDIDFEEWERMLAVNLTAPFLLAQRAFGRMRERGYGRIVFVSSIAAFTGGFIGAHYAASKAGLHGLAHSLARQGAAHGVTVNVIAPGLIETDMIPADPAVREQLAATRAVGRIGSPDEVADLVAAVVRNGYLSNQSILIDGGVLPS
jgi:3-oxoacyl-[acyl-carrier protein] reductase